MSQEFSLARAGRWLLDSGIQESCGGVARYYRSETGANRRISTEITGYTASGLVYLFEVTGEEKYLDRARRTAGFLADRAWNAELRTFPFEHPSPSPDSGHQAYFFDCGIIIRGLLAVWRRSQQPALLEIARTAGQSMIDDFRAGGEYHPIVDLPEKAPAHRTQQWSRLPGCYQLKAALAWLELAEATGHESFRKAYLDMLNVALAKHAEYLPGTANQLHIMDRLHAYCYFLEGLTPLLDRPECVEAYRRGVDAVSRYLRDIAGTFARADVYAQLLRARIYGARAIGINMDEASEEAGALAGFQAASDDPRIEGGFFFGKRDGKMSPHINPVSTVFAIQALELWRDFQAEGKPPCRKMLI